MFVDRYDAFVPRSSRSTADGWVGQLQRLIRDGLAAGIRVVVTGDRTLLTGRLAALAENKLVLRMADRADYALAGLYARAIPADMPNGRGFRLPAGDLLQIAVLSAEPQGAAENQALREPRRPGRTAGSRPFRVDPLPVAISSSRRWSCPRARCGSWSEWAATISPRCGSQARLAGHRPVRLRPQHRARRPGGARWPRPGRPGADHAAALDPGRRHPPGPGALAADPVPAPRPPPN